VSFHFKIGQSNDCFLLFLIGKHVGFLIVKGISLGLVEGLSERIVHFLVL